MILSAISISHQQDLHISIIPDIKDCVIKLVHLLSISLQITISKVSKFFLF